MLRYLTPKLGCLKQELFKIIPRKYIDITLLKSTLKEMGTLFIPLIKGLLSLIFLYKMQFSMHWIFFSY